MSKSTIASVVVVLALLLVLIVAGCGQQQQSFQAQGVTNFDSIHLSDLPESTATPVLLVNEQSGGSANVIEAQVAGTAVWYITSAGAVAQTGGLDLNGADLTIDADGDTILGQTGSTDDAADITLGASTGYFSILTGNFRVGNQSPSTSQDGEDAYIEGGFEVDGTARFDGAIAANSTLDVDGNITSGTGALTITDNVLIDGAADAEQLVIQGNGTQTNNPFVIEQSDGTDKFTVSNAGNTVIAGTLDAQGNVSDTGGTLTIADNAAVTGQADAEQLVVTGYTTQTNSILVVEDSSNSDIFEVTTSQINANNNPIVNIGAAGTDFGSDGGLTTAATITVTSGDVALSSGNLSVSGTSDLQGNVSDSGGALTVADNVLIDGQADAEQLVVQGNGTQTNNPFVVEQSDGTDKFTVSDAGAVDAASTINYGTNNMYPVGFGTASYAMDFGTTAFTDTTTVALTNVTTPTIALCGLAENSVAAEAICTTAITGTTVTLKLWAADGTSAGSTGDTDVYYLIIGQE